MMTDEATAKYKPVVREGLAAFGSDPSYAIAIAEQAGSLASQQAAKANRVTLSAGESETASV